MVCGEIPRTEIRDALARRTAAFTSAESGVRAECRKLTHVWRNSPASLPHPHRHHHPPEFPLWAVTHDHDVLIASLKAEISAVIEESLVYILVIGAWATRTGVQVNNSRPVFAHMSAGRTNPVSREVMDEDAADDVSERALVKRVEMAEETLREVKGDNDAQEAVIVELIRRPEALTGRVGIDAEGSNDA
ncbi:hypothetical protein CONLIGDRAFT_687661 [Coniochaeta ligniaria NRRL 30616]|uniref:Uncharacterized protein n=1 Tax=Coniochaeta ligniaria NRRL 30616 TaxID=1408157 RepID=A0A1J7I4M7_9PEZI|nr:hypothetical protein CONLIGDRAFT_687661 [Coniochaeta ligniaria NRRL 30616]